MAQPRDDILPDPLVAVSAGGSEGPRVEPDQLREDYDEQEQFDEVGDQAGGGHHLVAIGRGHSHSYSFCLVDLVNVRVGMNKK